MEIEISWVIAKIGGTTEHKRTYHKEPPELTKWIIYHLLNPEIVFVKVRYAFAEYKFLNRCWVKEINDWENNRNFDLQIQIDKILKLLKEIDEI